MSRLSKAVSGKRKRKPKKEKESAEERPPSRSRKRRSADPKRKKTKETAAPTEEPEAVKTARIRIRKMLRDVTKDAPPAAIGLVLAIVNQETGSQTAANTLIDELSLDKKFGIKKF